MTMAWVIDGVVRTSVLVELSRKIVYKTKQYNCVSDLTLLSRVFNWEIKMRPRDEVNIGLLPKT
jgi:hypothetical protein